MSPQQFSGIVLLVTIITCATIYSAATVKPPDPEIVRARQAYEVEKLELQRKHLQRNSDIMFYGGIGLLGAICGALLILASGVAKANVKRASICRARIGEHSEIPVHYNDLQHFYPIAVNLSLAEIQASISTSQERTWQLSRQMIEDITNYTRVLAAQRGLVVPDPNNAELPSPALLPALIATPTFADLLRQETIAPGKPLVMGFSQGQPQYRSLHDIKSLAISGWQGSGKTISTAYLIAASTLAYGVRTYVIDPHRHHPESLSALIKPLECSGHVTVVNPFDTPALLRELNHILDQRLAGKRPATPGILLVIDEMARLAKSECFDDLILFLERCTEETRKANMSFFGCSHKWTARYFKGRADIRGCMNSMLIHKTKPSQADLLLEDAHDKHLVKQLQRPGEAVLVTDYAPPVTVAMPFCTRQDIETVADLVGMAANGRFLEATVNAPINIQTENQRAQHASRSRSDGVVDHLLNDLAESPTSAARTTKGRKGSSDVISLLFHRKKLAVRQKGFDPSQLTVDQLREQIQRCKHQEPGITQAEIAKQAGMSPSLLSKILNGQRPLKDEDKSNLYKILFVDKPSLSPALMRHG